ncbi:MAG: radical SAM protein [Planctomycetes bacterium]|nr:radical SAM protein [Planctomycetota bacterium]
MSETILEKILSDAYRNNMPVTCLFEITRHCFFSCKHCYAYDNKRRREMSFGEICSVLKQLKNAGTLFLTITGGEPLSRKDFLRIVRFADKMGFYLTIFSNAYLLDQRTVKALSGLNIYYVGISLYGAKQSTHDGITGQPGSFDRLISAVKLLKKNGIGVVLKLVLMENNATEHKAMKRLAKKLKAVCQADPTITPRDNAGLSPVRLRPSAGSLRKIFVDWKKGLAFCEKNVLPQEFFECAAGRSFCAVNAYGDLLACVQIPVSAGSLLKRKFSDIWRNSRLLRKLRGIKMSDISECADCKIARYCGRCPGLAYVEDGSLYGKSSEACRQSRIMKSIMDTN